MVLQLCTHVQGNVGMACQPFRGAVKMKSSSWMCLPPPAWAPLWQRPSLPGKAMSLTMSWPQGLELGLSSWGGPPGEAKGTGTTRWRHWQQSVWGACSISVTLELVQSKNSEILPVAHWEPGPTLQQEEDQQWTKRSHISPTLSPWAPGT